ncbi:hypothetical protein ACFQU7_15485 [Pseudoroseomonas wenyumeiae]
MSLPHHALGHAERDAGADAGCADACPGRPHPRGSGAAGGGCLRLNARVGGLKRHFDQAQDDIRQIEISTDKIVRRGGRIESVELEDAALPAPAGESSGPASLPG